ncbi:hypothetical protein EJB05_56437, partial [Eragrostis curvula]
MSTQSGQLVSNSRSEEEIRRKRRKRKRVVVVLEVSIMAIIANRYQRRRSRHIVDPEEALERNVEGRKQMLRNLYQGSNRYCYDSLRLTKRSFGDLCDILRKSSRGFVPWNDEMDKVLLDAFAAYFNKGDRCQNGWKPHVYSAAVKNVREKCNVNITKCNIDSRSKTSDKHYHVISGLLSTSGFGWDWDKNKLKVDSDSV